MAYTTSQAVTTLNGYLGISESQKKYIENTKSRGFLFTLSSGEEIVIFVYPLVHKQDNTKNYFDTRDSGAYERGVAWNYAITHKLKYFCIGVNDSVDKYTDYVFSLECSEQIIEKISGTSNGVRNGPGNQIIIPNDYIPCKDFDRIVNKLGIYIAAISRNRLQNYLETYDNRPYMVDDDTVDLSQLESCEIENDEIENEYKVAAEHLQQYVIENGYQIPSVRETVENLYSTFQEKFAPSVLESISDDKILQAMFYTTEQTNDSLCYWLEFQSDSRQYCGSIAGGSSYKFGLFQKKEDGVWISGSPNKPQELSDAQALSVGKEIRKALVDGCHLIESKTLNTLSDYEKFDDELKNTIGEKYWNLAWVHKYFSMMYPKKLCGFHSSEWQRHVLYALQIRPSEKYYARSGQIAMVAKYANWIYAEFFGVFYDQFGDIKHFLRLGTSDDAGNYADEWRKHHVVAIGWRDLGNLDDYVIANDINRKAVAEKLEQLFYPEDARTASRKAGEVSAFYRSNANSIFVAADGYSLLGLVDNIGAYFYSPESPMANRKPGKWHMCFDEGEQLPNKNAGYMTSCYELSAENDTENMLFLYKKYYYELDDTETEEDESMETTEFTPLIFNTGIDIGKDRNRIVFGAPGTGKSFLLKDDCEKHIENTAGEYERVTFHPDYTYSQFVGSYKPVTDSEGKICYDFVPGPFMRIYVEALKSGRTENPQPYLLLIEEINRAKVAAVFGDVFQLLDRDENGVSEYAIQATEDISKFLASKLGGKPENYKKIRIPDNMFIWATMNSADQGVFPMDTAFKRRWSFEYLGINENESGVVGTILLGADKEPIVWNRLRKAINDKLAKEYKVNEDKLMGPYFLAKKLLKVDENGILNDQDKFIKTFKSKVIMYLYEDAAKQYKHKLFEGCDSSKYSSVCEAFDEIGIRIFGESFKENYYDQQEG